MRRTKRCCKATPLPTLLKIVCPVLCVPQTQHEHYQNIYKEWGKYLGTINTSFTSRKAVKSLTAFGTSLVPKPTTLTGETHPRCHIFHLLLLVTSATSGSQIQNPGLNNTFQINPSSLRSFLPTKISLHVNFRPCQLPSYLLFKYSSRRILFWSHLPFVESVFPRKCNNSLKKEYELNLCKVMLSLKKAAKQVF